MDCAKCGCRIGDDDEASYMGENLCIDCYTDVLSPSKPCDPWAVYAAKSLSQDGYILTKRQTDILAALGDKQGIEPAKLALRVGLTANELERELTTLRHMEKIRAAKQLKLSRWSNLGIFLALQAVQNTIAMQCFHFIIYMVYRNIQI